MGKDGRGEDRFTSREMIEAEQRLHCAAALMADRERREVNDADRQAALARAQPRGLVLSAEQSDALAHITAGSGLGVVVGHAGTGKSVMLGVAREAWEAAGYEVRGVTLSVRQGALTNVVDVTEGDTCGPTLVFLNSPRSCPDLSGV